MSMIEDLPDELLSKIVISSTIATPGLQCQKAPLRNLRLVSKRLSGFASALLFASLQLKFTGDMGQHSSRHVERSAEIVLALATQSTRLFQNTTDLFIESTIAGRHPENPSETQKTIVTNIFDAISALRNLRTMGWVYSSDHDPYELTVNVMHALSTLPSFQGFSHLLLWGALRHSFSFQSISNLHKVDISWGNDSTNRFSSEVASLLARCPSLTDLRLDAGFGPGYSYVELSNIFSGVDGLDMDPLPLRRLDLDRIVVTPDDISTRIQRFRNLEFLGILENPATCSATAFGEICAILSRHEIYPRSLKTDVIHDPLFLDYLRSCPGLYELTIIPKHPLDDSPEIREIFFKEILPRHRETLRHLCFGTVDPTVWSLPLPGDQLTEIIKCHKLYALVVNIVFEKEEVDRGDTTKPDTWMRVGLQLPELAFLHMRPCLDFHRSITAFVELRQVLVLISNSIVQ
ncbi:hypothetical protein P691DRAFT_775075, partial [Macrolepiota fuliginosa MF-IS2]